MNNLGLMRGFFRHISSRRKRQFIMLLFLILLASLAEMASIGALLSFLSVLTAPEKIYAHPLAQPFIARFSISSAESLLLPLTLAFVLVVLLSGAIRLALLWFQMRLSHTMGSDLGIEIYRRTLYQSYETHVARNTSEVIAGISSKVGGVVHGVILPCLTMVGALPILAGIALALLWMDAVVSTLAFLGFGAIYFLIVFFSKKRLSRDSRRVNEESERTIKALQEGLGGIRDVLLDGAQDIYCDIYKKSDRNLRRARGNIQIISGSPRYIIESVGMALIAAIACMMTLRAQGLASAIPLLGALALGAQRLLPLLQQSYHSWASIKGAEQVLESVLHLLNQPLPAFADAPPAPPLPFHRRILLENLSFRYAPKSALVLDAICLELPRGKRIGFIGETGSGKSTLMDVVMGLLEPRSGALRIDEILIDASNVRAWQAHIAHVPQAIFLSDATVSENIAFGVSREKIDLERVKSAAAKAQIAETIEAWPTQYQTEVGERGIRLSGGQRQRIGIARALYKKADVIVFDEATSALDNETEQAVMRAIEQLDANLTILIIAHRLSTLRNCDLIVELKEGRVKRIGQYSEIIESKSP
jgi:ATP-binding cassette subfamily B protein